MASYSWPLSGEEWLQSKDSNRFEPGSGDGKVLSAALRPDVLIGAKTRAPSCKRADCGFFPRAFHTCPQCGEALAAPSAATSIWLPPFGGDANITPGIGTRISYRRFGLAAASSNRERLPDQVFELPASGEYAFVVDHFGAHAPVTLAMNTLGGCYVSALAADDKANAWHALSTNKASRRTSLSARQVSVALLGSDRRTLLVPTDEGVGALTPDLARLSLDYTILSSGRVAAGLAQIDALGAFALQESHAGYALTAIDVAGKPIARINATPGAPAGKTFDAPLCYALRGDIYWVGEDGYFHARNIDKHGTEMQLQWRPWPPGWQAVRTCGCAHIGDSTTSHIGDTSIWQLGFSPTQGYAYLPLGSAAPQAVDVPRMTSGKLVFHLADPLHRNQAPWDDAPVSSGPDKDDVVFPLLENASDNQYLAVRVNRGDNETIRALLESTEEQSVTILFYDGQVESSWRTTMTSPWKTSAFFHGRSIFLHHPGATKLYRFLLAD